LSLFSESSAKILFSDFTEEAVDRGRLWKAEGCGEQKAVDRGRLWKAEGCRQQKAVESRRVWTAEGRGE
jgi:hypothetical protein